MAENKEYISGIESLETKRKPTFLQQVAITGIMFSMALGIISPIKATAAENTQTQGKKSYTSMAPEVDKGAVGDFLSNNAKITPDTTKADEVLTREEEETSYQKLMERYEMKLPTYLEKLAKEAMSKTPTMQNLFQKFEKLDIPIKSHPSLITDGNMVAAYDPEKNEILIDSNILDYYITVKNAFLKTHQNKLEVADVERILKHEIQHSIDYQKVDLKNLDAESALMVMVASEIKARQTEGIEAFELGAEHWEVFKYLAPETSKKIEEEAQKRGWKRGEPLKEGFARLHLSDTIAKSFMNDLIEDPYTERKLTLDKMYRERYAMFIATEKVGNGTKHLYPQQVMELLELDKTNIDTAALIKAAIPTEQECKKDITPTLEKYNIPKSKVSKIPISEKMPSPLERFAMQGGSGKV